MNRAIRFSLLLAFVIAAPAFADDEKFRTVVRDTVTREIGERNESKESEDSSTNRLPPIAHVGGRTSRTPFGFYAAGLDDSLHVASCPMDVEGSPTYDAMRNHFREFTDDEMWKICLNRHSNPVLGAFPSACACSLMAHPSPWRAVAVPHAMERDESIETIEEVPAPTPQTTGGSGGSSPGVPRNAGHP